MRLKQSRNSAEEDLTLALAAGYRILQWLRSDYQTKVKDQSFTPDQDNETYTDAINRWGSEVFDTLASTFPTDLEANTFLNPPSPGFTTMSDKTDPTWFSLQRRMEQLVGGLKQILAEDLRRYTDLPIQERLYIEDIDSFRRVRDVNADAVRTHLNGGYLDHSEDRVQIGLEQILDEPMHKKDWGGEQNDLYYDKRDRQWCQNSDCVPA